MVLRNPPVGTECRECGHPFGHNVGCRTWHAESLAEIDRLKRLLARWLDGGDPALAQESRDAAFGIRQ
jgi:hypothetical protein